MSQRPELLIAQVTEQFEVSRATLRRGIDSGRFPNAHKDDSGRWLIPIDDVLMAGFKARKTWLVEQDHELGQEPKTREISEANEPSHFENERARELAHRVEILETQLAAAKLLQQETTARAETAERALLMLTASPIADSSGSTQAAAENPKPQGFWAGLFRSRT